MKIRNGFVSNSSSSSFILITTEDTLHKVLSRFNEQEKGFICSVLPKEISFELDGNEYIQFCTTFDSSSVYDAASDVSDEIADRAGNILDNFRNAFKKYKNSYAYKGGEV